MPATAVYALPYPALSDTPDVPRDIQALADRLELLLRPPLVTSLPGSPVDKQECYFVADATNGIIWHLRYRAAAPGAYKWEVIGGPPLLSQIDTSEGTAATTYVDLATPGPSITVPLAGQYDVEVRTATYNFAAASANMSFAVGGTAATDADSAVYGGPAGSGVTLAAKTRKTVAAASTAIVSKYKTSSGTCSFYNRRLIVEPIRVG